MTTEKYIPLHILEGITNEFSAHSRIGTGGYGDVYKGVHNKREIAVKLLRVDTLRGLDDQHFKNEVGNLLRAKHPNIVQLAGYCYETRNIYVEHNGVNDFSQRIYRVICFEYLQGGSLDKRLYDQSFAPDWSTRYNIIKGISEGLNFLHKCVPQIWHLDLKPANILLDSYMEPKLADFGLSRLFAQSHTHDTESIIGTRKYMPPEFIEEHKISPKNDVFSLGVVMMDIMKGPTCYSNSIEMGDMTQLSQEVLRKWSTTIEATSKYRSEEIQQVKTCVELAIRCVDPERDIRPTIADILDTLNKTETCIPKKQVADMLPCRPLSPKNTVAKSLNTMTAEVGNITNKHEHCNFMPRDSFNINIQQVPERETSSAVEQKLIIGRTEEKQKILSMLCGSITDEMVLLPIYGMGGIGKTTLAQLVFNDTQFQGYSRVWVYVPQEFDLNKIGNSIISQLSNETSDVANMQIIHKRLGDLLSGKRILIVLDDLCEEDQDKLGKLKAMLRLGKGSKMILVTTRVEAIARKICSTVMPYKLEGLTDDMCWTIIQQKSDFKNRPDKDQLEQIGKEISIKCQGVALLAQSLGYMLRDMTSVQWQSARDNDISNLSSEQEVFVSLRLSYYHMCECLKLCFSYCAVFPKGHNIVKYDLIHQWISLGFAKPYGTFDSMQLCEKYVTQLLGMSFLEYSKAPLSHGRRGEGVTLFTMHDLVHDLASVMLADKVNEKGNAVGSSCHYALLTDCSKPLQLSLSSPENARFKKKINLFQKRSTPENIKALFFLDCRKVNLHGSAFSPAKYLHVLDLSECFIRKLPYSIGRLKQLRYLHAPRIRDWRIPSCITELSELNYLNLRASENISALPKSIGDMEGLMHLDLSGCVGICELPLSFAELKQLVHLNLSHCGLSVAEALGGCIKLQYLNLSGCHRVRELPKSFLKLKQLVHLDLSRCGMSISEGFAGFTELQHLNLSEFCRTAYLGGLSEIIGNLTKLKYLNLSRSMQVMARSDDKIASLLNYISTLSDLEYLDLSFNAKLYNLPESFCNLTNLHTLDLLGCLNFKLPANIMAEMVSLKVLNVDISPRSDESCCASLPHFVVHTSNDKCSSNIILLQPTNPNELTIDRLENVNCAEEAESIKLTEKQKIEELTFQWTGGAQRFVDDKEVLEQLVPPSSVRYLTITGYRSVSFPNWIMDIRQYLPNLLKINLCDFPNCNNLPPLGHLPNLEELNLYRMESLEEWNTAHYSGKEGTDELMFPKLQNLRIEQCANLRTKPCLPRAMSLYIEGCDTMLSSWGESSSHSGTCHPITELNVAESKVPMHAWRLLHHLPALRKLTIIGSSDLTTSPEILQFLSSLKSLSLRLIDSDHAELPRWLVDLTSLQELSLSGCAIMTSLPRWLGELPSLRRFELMSCTGISSLPDSIQQLTKLECLIINECPTLERWCESKGNKRKLAHITEVVPSSLRADVIQRDVHPDGVRSAVMNMPGFTEEALRVVVSHLVDDNYRGSEYMSMHEEHRVLWIRGFLANRMGGLEQWKTTHCSCNEGSNELIFPDLQRWTMQQCAKLTVKPCLPRVMLDLTRVECDNALSSCKQRSSHGGTSSSFPLTGLNVAESKVPLHQWRLLHHLPALRRLVITGCSDLTTSHQIIHSLSSLESLCLKSLSQAELPRWLVELTSLQALELSWCRSMTSLPEWLGELTTLEDLKIKLCKEIRSLPDSIQQLNKLKHLSIDGCEGIISLPDSIQQLTKLEHLFIDGCPKLVRWCKSRENKRKLAHITEVIPSSLRADPNCGTLLNRVHPAVLRSAVMNTPGFRREALRFAVSHLEKMPQVSEYLSMNEEHRVLWLRSFLAKHYYVLTTGDWRYRD